MKIKRFFAPDMRQAIRMVRDDQGPDAVILSTRTTGGGVEIVAAVDYDAELVHSMIGDGREEGGAAPAGP
ncbi:flagellar biosynthesis protein FlhF, partial [Thioalkalivibrio sp. XN8]|nr:flagellar biosynthesis protein FlhF [Thioalkalivibrio sp. XN8]